MYMKPEPQGSEDPRFGFNAGLVIAACAVFTVALGLLPTKYFTLSYQSIATLLPR
jgi:hypothetical protein